MKYIDFDLHEDLQKGLKAAKYVECLPVQEAVLDKGIDGSDLYVQSQTGTGKTAGYLVTVFERWLKMDEKKQVLILVPTRELAVQVCDEARLLARFIKINIGAFYGGVGYNPQVKKIKSGVQMIIATPGRIIDLCDKNELNFKNLGFLVIDEADRMFDMGFYPALRKILKLLPSPKELQTMLFSATLSSSIKNLAWECTVNPKEINIEPKKITAKKIEQKLFHVANDKKVQLLLGILNKENCDSVLIFCNTKRCTEALTKRLRLNNLEAEFLNGSLPQRKRLSLVKKFKQKSVSLLVATDVAARGIDVDDLNMVINFDLPNEAANYVHRIGRTARAGKEGITYALCSERDVYNLAEIEKFINERIPSATPDGSLYLDDLSESKKINLGGNGRARTVARKSSSGGKGKNSSRKSSGNTSENRVSENRHSIDRKNKRNGKNNYRGKGCKYSSRSHLKNKNVNFSSKYDNENLCDLSFEDRMEHYKKRYGKNTNRNVGKSERNTNQKVNRNEKKTKKYSHDNFNRKKRTANSNLNKPLKRKTNTVTHSNKERKNNTKSKNKILSFFEKAFTGLKNDE